MLLEFAEIYDIIGDKYRAAAYKNAAKGDPPGKSINEKIEEYRRTGKVAAMSKLLNSKINGARVSDLVTATHELGQIKNIGAAAVKKFTAAGIYTVGQLQAAAKKNPRLLTAAQQVGLRWYRELQLKIPRSEVAAIANEIAKLLEARGLYFTIVGSYRRGAPESSDVDILAYSDTVTTLNTSAISQSPGFGGWFAKGPQKLAFVYKGRSIDIFLAAADSFIPYLLYSTGSAKHNEIIRGRAKSLGYKLNQIEFTKGGRRLILKNEEELYKILGLDYIPPEKR